MDKIWFSIITKNGDKSERIDFSLTNDCGEIEGESFNPVNGWTGYTKFDQGWSEQDEELQEMLRAIKEYSQSEELTDLILNVLPEDVGRTFNEEYFCNWFVDENKTYEFYVEINDVEFGDDDDD